MRDARLWQLRLKAERDPRLANASLMIILRVISERANSHDAAHEAFPLPWTKVSAWTGITEERNCRHWITKLEKWGYIAIGPLRGCPPTRRVSLRFNSVENDRIETVVNDRIKAVENNRPHISKSFRQGIIKEAASPHAGKGKVNGSLRSKDDASAPITRQQLASGLRRWLEETK